MICCFGGFDVWFGVWVFLLCSFVCDLVWFDVFVFIVLCGSCLLLGLFSVLGLSLEGWFLT